MPVWTVSSPGTPLQTSGSNPASGTWTIPANSVADDFLICYMYSRDNTFDWTVSGVTLKNSANGATGRIGIYYKRLAGGDANPTWTRSVSSTNCTVMYGCFLVRRADPTVTDPFEAESGAPAAWSNTTTPNPDSVVTISDGAMVIVISGANNDGTHSPSTSPATYSEITDHEDTTGTDASATSFYRIVATAGTEDPGTFTRAGNATASDDGYVWTGAIKPHFFRPRITTRIG